MLEKLHLKGRYVNTEDAQKKDVDSSCLAVYNIMHKDKGVFRLGPEGAFSLYI
jgi:hypothetical protein